MKYLTIENDNVVAQIGDGASIPIHNITEFYDLANVHGLDNWMCSSAMDFPVEETQDEDCIRLACQIRGNDEHAIVLELYATQAHGHAYKNCREILVWYLELEQTRAADRTDNPKQYERFVKASIEMDDLWGGLTDAEQQYIETGHTTKLPVEEY